MHRKPVIAHVAPHFHPYIGGGSVHIADIVNNTTEFYHKIITPYPSGERIEKFSDNCKIYRLPLELPLSITPWLTKEKEFKFINTIISRFYALYNLRAEINLLQDANLIHFHGHSFPIFRRFLFFLNSYRYSKISKINKPKLLTVHNYHGNIDDSIITNDYVNMIKSFKQILTIDKQIYNFCKITNSDANIELFSNGINTEIFRPKITETNSKFRIGFLGRLVQETLDVEILNQLIHSIPNDIEIHMAFSGDLRLLGNLADIKENLFFYEDIDNDAVPSFLNKLDILFNPVLHNLNTRVTMESMACETPVILYNFNKSRYPVVNEVTGYLIDFEDKVKILENLLSLIERLRRNRKSNKQVGKNARRIILKNFNISSSMYRLREIYSESISK